MNRPPASTGLRHVALFVSNLQRSEQFYVEIMGMKVEWRPDPENVYLTSGHDNLALHQSDQAFSKHEQRLDHIGFIIDKIEQVDEWFQYLSENSVKIRTEPRTHRDGARSFYCYDPDDIVVQIIYHPPLSNAVT